MYWIPTGLITAKSYNLLHRADRCKFDEGDYRAPIVDTYNKYLADREKESFWGRKDKFVCLMDLALMAMKKLKAEGKLADQEESDEINAMQYCSSCRRRR